MYTEAKVDVTQEIDQRAQQAAQAGADHCALCSISCVTSTLASVYSRARADANRLMQCWQNTFQLQPITDSIQESHHNS